jgi:hypothetical protein
MLTIVVGSMNAQSLSIQDIEVQSGAQAEFVVSLTGGTAATALQFNLKLPEDVTFAQNGGNYGAILGSATDGHTLNVETLDSGDLLFVLYSTDLNTFMDGELLRLPLKVYDEATTSKGKLYTIRTATADAVSKVCEDVTFSVFPEQELVYGDVNGDGDVNLVDVTMTVSHILGQTPEGFVEAGADIDGNNVVDIQDLATIIDIVLK